MKKRMLSVAAAALLLAGCSENQTGNPANIPGTQLPVPPPETGAEPDSVNGLGVRQLDGSKNNETFNHIGSTLQRLSRIALADYGDLISTLAGASRPGPREISNAVVDQAGADMPNTFGTSDFLWQWGQFLDHDIDLTPDGTGPSPVAVPAGDPNFDPGATGTVEIGFNRSQFDPTTGDAPGNPRQQMNVLTSWIDASNVYGSSLERALELRVAPDSPFLKTSGDGLLPLNVNSFENANGPNPDPTALFIAGDIRANEQIALTVMHTLFVREHNRLAAILQANFPDNSGNEIFYLARRLVSAEIQMISYNEFLPALLGPTALADYAGYNPISDGNIMNEFSTAAFRFGHSALSPMLLRLDAGGNPTAGGPLPLQSAFFSPSLLSTGADIEPFLRGLATQPHQRIDSKIVDDVRNFLFGPPGAGGLDLASLNIQRGRDHGLSSYNDTREALGLPRATAFSDITSDAGLQADLASVYASVDDVDLWVGGLAEDPVVAEGSQLGETFRRILVIQFKRLRDGDRYWYEKDLTTSEMALIGGTTLADVIRNNTGIGAELQDNVFLHP